MIPAPFPPLISTTYMGRGLANVLRIGVSCRVLSSADGSHVAWTAAFLDDGAA